MLRRHASLIIASLLFVLVAAACIVRTGRPRRAQPVYIEQGKPMKHKKMKHKKHKD